MPMVTRTGSTLGAGPIGWAPLSAHAAVSAASIAVIAIKRFMGCLLLSGTQPMLEGARNTGTPLVSRFGNSVGRQAQRETRSGTGLAPYLHVSTEQPGVLPGDRQAEPAPRARPRGIGPVEAIEDVLEMVGSDPGSAVGDFDRGAVRAPTHPDDDVPTAVIERVADQVGDDPIDAGPSRR